MSLETIAKKVAVSLQAMALVLGIGSASIVGVAVSAAPAFGAACPGGNPAVSGNPLTEGAACGQANGTQDQLFGSNGIFKLVANTLIFLVGAIAVIFLIIGGLRYVISNGDSKNVTAAKDTILYAVIGIVVAVISYALVNFVITTLATPAAP